MIIWKKLKQKAAATIESYVKFQTTYFIMRHKRTVPGEKVANEIINQQWKVVQALSSV